MKSTEILPNFILTKLPTIHKKLIFSFTLTLMAGVTVGLVYLATLTQMNPTGTTEHYRGSQAINELDIPDKYPKPFKELLLTTHNHVISFSMIFLLLGAVFLGTSVPNRWKAWLIIEPFISTWTTFAGIWAIRYIHPWFSYLVILSGMLMYATFYFMAFLILKELTFSKYPNRSA